MGRTVPTFTMVIQQEMESWGKFRRGQRLEAGIHQMTAHNMIAAVQRIKRRKLDTAPLKRQRTARRKPAARRQGVQLGRIAWDGDQPLIRLGKIRGGLEQLLGIGMAGCSVDRVHTGIFRSNPSVHHQYRVAHLGYNAQVMLMTNHYHLLVETPKGNLSRLMHYLNGSYTNYLNRKRRRSGHLFEGRYKAIVVERDSYLLELSRYLHLNPVRARLVAKPEDYPYSSYRAYVSRGEDDLTDRDLLLGMISGGGRGARRRYREFVERVLGEELENPLKGVYGGIILGGTQFIKEVLGRLKDRVLEQEGISQRRELRTGWGKEVVVEAVCSHFSPCDLC